MAISDLIDPYEYIHVMYMPQQTTVLIACINHVLDHIASVIFDIVASYC